MKKTISSMSARMTPASGKQVAHISGSTHGKVRTGAGIDLLIEKLNKPHPLLTKEQIQKATRDINKRMECFRIEHRWYMAKSIESARTAYINC